ncbi:MAG: hypothetical protein LBU86_00940, partial [Oscillospiraceae bacterium]|nr:hypothetical protein [Oscillospiraceae bacterium]
MTEKKKSLLISVLFIAVGALILILASGLEAKMQNDVGSGFFPMVAAGCLIVFAAVKLVLTLRMPGGAPKESGGDRKGGWMTVALMG